MGDDGYFGEEIADRHDQSSAEMFDPAVVDPVVEFLVERAHGGRILELGLGTGRIALPLADLMAELAGMRPRERWAGWLGEPLASDSRTFVAVWEMPRRREMETMS